MKCHVMLYNMCPVMLYNMCRVMLHNMSHVMLCIPANSHALGVSLTPAG